MTITKKLTRHGNSYALVIERPILELLGIDPEEDELQISTPDGASIVIKPIKDEKHREKLSGALKKINRKYGRALKNLVE